MTVSSTVRMCRRQARQGRDLVLRAGDAGGSRPGVVESDLGVVLGEREASRLG